MERYTKMGKYMGEENLLGVPTVENPRSLDRLEKALTGQKDTDLLIMSNLDDETLLSFCLVSRQANQICKDEHFWRERFVKRYGQPPFAPQNWKRLYLKSVYYLNNEGIDNDVLYNSVKNKEHEFINLIIFLDKFKISKNRLNILSFFLGTKGAIEVGDREMVKLFTEMGKFSEPDLNLILRFVVVTGHKDLIDFFVEKGATNLTTALHTAIGSGNLDMVKYIVSKMPDYSFTEEFLKECLTFTYNYPTNEISKYFIALLENVENKNKRYINKMNKTIRQRSRK